MCLCIQNRPGTNESGSWWDRKLTSVQVFALVWPDTKGSLNMLKFSLQSTGIQSLLSFGFELSAWSLSDSHALSLSRQLSSSPSYSCNTDLNFPSTDSGWSLSESSKQKHKWLRRKTTDFSELRAKIQPKLSAVIIAARTESSDRQRRRKIRVLFLQSHRL